MKSFCILLLAFSLLAGSTTVSASAHKPKRGQVSTTCHYNKGPKLGEVESLLGHMKAVSIGKPCNDGAGSSGFTVFDAADEAAEEAEEAAKAQAKKQSAEVLAANCQFNQGPRAGQIENYAGKIAPLPLGAPCTDGLRSIGVIVAE
jgi:hypothetical protein